MYLLVSELLNPFLLLMIVAVLGLALLWRKPGPSRKRLWLVTLALGLLWLICTPLAAHLALRTLESGYPPLERRPKDAKAIVVLSGSLRAPNARRGWAELEHDTLRRCQEAKRLCRQGEPVPIIVCGGKVDSSQPGPTLAEAMGEFLRADGIDQVIEEQRSRSTYENAVKVAAILRERDLERCVLVTDSTHLMRASACFREQGIRCIPAPAYCRSEELQWQLTTFLPSPHAAVSQHAVLHEWLGLLWYKICRRI